MPPRDFAKTCFVIMPFGSKPVGTRKVNFDRIYEQIFEPAIKAVSLPEGGRLRPARTDKDFFSGDIGQEMFELLNQSRVALADITGLNANVMYEIGIRHMARQAGTIIVRQMNASAPEKLPFDINHIKAFPYYYTPEKNAAAARTLVRRVLRESLVQNRLDSPVQIALRAQKDEPKNDQLQPLLLEAENALRRFDRPSAIATLRRASRLVGGNALISMRLGLLLRDQNDLQGAVESFTAAATEQPDYSDAWRERGVQEVRLKKIKEGEASLREAIRLNPDDFDALASLGGVLRKSERLAEALQMYERAVQVSSGHPYPLLMALKLRAKTRGTLGIDDTVKQQLVLAEAMRRGQAENAPPIDAPWSLFDLAEIRLYDGDADEFLAWVRKALKVSAHAWEPETFRTALQLLVDGGLQLDGLAEGLAAVDAKIASFKAAP